MKKFLSVVLLSSLLVGCSNIELDEVVSGAAGVAGCAAGYVVGNAGACVAVGGTAVGTSVILTKKSGGDSIETFRGEDGELSFVEGLAYMWSNFSSYLMTIAVGVGLFWLVTTYLGIRWRRPEEKELRKQNKELLNKVARMKEDE